MRAVNGYDTQLTWAPVEGAAGYEVVSSQGSVTAEPTRPQPALVQVAKAAVGLVFFCPSLLGARESAGRPDMAQAGGNQPQNLAAALESVLPWVESRL